MYWRHGVILTELGQSRQVTRSKARLDCVLAAWGHLEVLTEPLGHEIESEVGLCTGGMGSFLLS